MPRAVFLLTDFGLRDPYVGIMKAVLLRLAPQSPVIDLTHDIPPQDVLAGAVALEDSLPHLPEDAVVCAVVDPGVGTNRRPLLVVHGERLLVAPDNGLLTPFLPTGEAFEILPGGPVQPTASSTFHGRDVFAPAAALLASGAKLNDLANPLDDPVYLDFPRVVVHGDKDVTLTLLVQDHFGNLATNLSRDEAASLGGIEAAHLNAGGRVIGPIRHTFADAEPGEPLLYWNSAGRLALGVNGGSAAEALALAPGDRVSLFLGGRGD